MCLDFAFHACPFRGKRASTFRRPWDFFRIDCVSPAEGAPGAWVEMRQIVPRREDEILEMLAILNCLQRGIHEYVPDARLFVRQGLE